MHMNAGAYYFAFGFFHFARKVSWIFYNYSTSLLIEYW
jgi:hypothetical protein